MPAGGAPSARPVLASLAGYRPEWIRGDVAAGLATPDSRTAIGARVGRSQLGEVAAAAPLLTALHRDPIPARLLAIADAMPAGTRWFLLDANAITQTDSTAAAMLEEVRADLAARGVRLGLAELHANVAGLLGRVGLLAAVGPDLIFDDLDDALRAFEASATTGGKP